MKAGFLGAEVLEQRADALGFGAARFELVGADRAGARTFADESGALAVQLALEFALPEAEFGLELGVGRRKLVGLGLDDFEPVAVGWPRKASGLLWRRWRPRVPG